jgi:cytochrome c
MPEEQTTMKRLMIIAAATLALGSVTPAGAADAEALAKQHNCLQCHATDKKILGPSYKDVAKKYKGNKDAAALLVKHVRTGSKGVWGPIPMPPNDKVNEADATTIVKWILAM